MRLRYATRIRYVVCLTFLVMALHSLAVRAAAETRHHYDIAGGLTAVADPGVASALTHFSASAPRVTQASDHFYLAARLAAAPLGCASDTIFLDGFDP